MSREEAIREPSYLEYKGKHKGIFAWILSTDHKRIGMLYLFSILSMFRHRGHHWSAYEI